MGDLGWFIGTGVLFAVLGVVFLALGWRIWRKRDMNLIIHYHCDRVSEENKPAFCALAGIGVFVMGIGFCLSGICTVWFRTASAFIPMTAGLVLGIALEALAVIRYNR